MNTYTKSIIMAAGMLAVLPAAFAAPGDPVTPVRGTVSAIDATANTITVQGRGGQTTTVLHVSAATKYYMDATGALTDIKVGDTIRVAGQTTGTTIAARRISEVPAEEAAVPAPAAPAGGAAPGGGGRRGFGVMGVVATITPALTITLPDKTTDTVTTDTATVTTVKPATMTDVKAQGNVSALTTGTGDAAMATEVHVMAAGGFGGRGGGGAGGAGGGNGAGGAGGQGGRRRGGGAGGGAGAPGAPAPGAGGAAPMAPAGQ